MGLLNLFQRDNRASPPPGPVKPAGSLLGWLRSRLGGWAGPGYSRGSPADQELRSEKVHSGPSGMTMPWFPPYLDNYTRETAQHRQFYRQAIGSDCNVKAALFGKIWGVSSLDLRIVPASKSYRDGEVADFATYCLTERLEGGIPELAWSILAGGLVDGYSITEKVFQLQDSGDYGGKIVLDQLKSKDVDHDAVLVTDPFRNIVSVRGLRYNAGQEFDPTNFVIYRHTPFYNSPVGISDLRAAYRPAWCIEAATRLRSIAIEKRAIPWVIGHYKNTTIKPSLEAALARAKSQTWFSVPEDARVEVVNAAANSDEIFHKSILDWKHDVFLGIVGSILSQLEGTTTDGRGSSKVHKSIADLFKWALSASLTMIINALVRDLVDLNYVVGRYPRANLSAVDVMELVQEANIDKTLNAMGLDLSRQDMYDRYGRQPPDGEDPTDKLAGQLPKPAGGPANPITPTPEEQAMTREMQPDRNDDQQPAAEVAGLSPFRGYSEQWIEYIQSRTAAS